MFCKMFINFPKNFDFIYLFLKQIMNILLMFPRTFNKDFIVSIYKKSFFRFFLYIFLFNSNTF